MAKYGSLNDVGPAGKRLKLPQPVPALGSEVGSKFDQQWTIKLEDGKAKR